MKKFMISFGTMMAGLAIMIATVSVNSTCCFYNHQDSVPEAAKKLRRF